MDKMAVLDVLLVGVPEIVLSMIFGVILCRGRDVKEYNIQYFYKMVFSAITIVTMIYFIRSNVNNLLIIALLSTFIYAVTFINIWKINIRNSLVVSSLIMFLIITSEVLTMFPVTKLIIENMLQYDFMSARYIWSFPTRLIQILMLFIVWKNNISLRNNVLLNYPWHKLEKSRKIMVTLLIFLLLLTIIFNMNYGEIFMKLKMNNIDMSLIGINLSFILIETLLFLAVTLILLNRTFKYEIFKEIIYKTPRDMFEMVVESSTIEEIRLYQEQLLVKINENDKEVRTYEKI